MSYKNTINSYGFISNAYIGFTDFRYAQLVDANFENAGLTVTDFRYANLLNANFSKVKFAFVDFQFTELLGVQFDKEDISVSMNFDSAKNFIWSGDYSEVLSTFKRQADRPGTRSLKLLFPERE